MIGKCGKPKEECKCGCDKDPRKGTIEKRRRKSKINIEELIRKNPMVGIFGLEALKLKSNV